MKRKRTGQSTENMALIRTLRLGIWGRVTRPAMKVHMYVLVSSKLVAGFAGEHGTRQSMVPPDRLPIFPIWPRMDATSCMWPLNEIGPAKG